MIKEEHIEDLEFLRAKLLKHNHQYISFNQLKGYNKEEANLYRAKFEELSSIMLALGLITEINSPIAGQRMFEKTDKIHLIDIKTAFKIQESANNKESLEVENLTLQNESLKFQLTIRKNEETIKDLTLKNLELQNKNLVRQWLYILITAILTGLITYFVTTITNEQSHSQLKSQNKN